MPKKELPRKVIRQELYWPTPLWHTTIEEFKVHPTKVSFNEDTINWVLNKEKNEKSVIKSNRGGWQSDLLNPNAELKPLTDQIKMMCQNLNLGIKDIIIPQIWINVNRKNHYNVLHQHGHYHLSGTYYVKIPKNCGRITFRDPRLGAIGNPFFLKSFVGGEYMRIKVTEGLLAIWPSFLDHYVETSETDEERISISFDIWNKNF